MAEDLWNEFLKSGRIDDYLRYKKESSHAKY